MPFAGPFRVAVRLRFRREHPPAASLLRDEALDDHVLHVLVGIKRSMPAAVGRVSEAAGPFDDFGLLLGS